MAAQAAGRSQGLAGLIPHPVCAANLTGHEEKVSVENFELLKVLGTGGEDPVCWEGVPGVEHWASYPHVCWGLGQATGEAPHPFPARPALPALPYSARVLCPLAGHSIARFCVCMSPAGICQPPWGTCTLPNGLHTSSPSPEVRAPSHSLQTPSSGLHIPPPAPAAPLVPSFASLLLPLIFLRFAHAPPPPSPWLQASCFFTSPPWFC